MSTITQVAPKETTLAVHDVFSPPHTDQYRYVVEPIATKSWTSANHVWTGVDILRNNSSQLRRRADLLDGRNGSENRRSEGNRKPVQRAKTAAIPRSTLTEVRPARRNTRDDISVCPSNGVTGLPAPAQSANAAGPWVVTGRPRGINSGYPPQGWQLPMKSDGSNDAVGFGPLVAASPNQDFSSAATVSTKPGNSRRIAPGVAVPFLGSQPPAAAASNPAATPSEPLEKRPTSSGLRKGDGRLLNRIAQRHTTTTKSPSAPTTVADPAETLQQATSSPRNPFDYNRVWAAAQTSAPAAPLHSPITNIASTSSMISSLTAAQQTSNPISHSASPIGAGSSSSANIASAATTSGGRHRLHLHQSNTATSVSSTTNRRRPSHHTSSDIVIPASSAATGSSSALTVPLNGSFSDRSRGGIDTMPSLAKYVATGAVTGSCSSSTTLESLDAASSAPSPDGSTATSGSNRSTPSSCNNTASGGLTSSGPPSVHTSDSAPSRGSVTGSADANAGGTLSPRRRSASIRRTAQSVVGNSAGNGTQFIPRQFQASGVTASLVPISRRALAPPVSSTSHGSSRRVQSVGNRQHRSTRGSHQTPLSIPDPIEASLMLGTRVRYSDNVILMNRDAGHPHSRYPAWTSYPPYAPQDLEARAYHGLPDAGEARSHHRTSRVPQLRGLRSSAPDQGGTGYATGQIMNITSLLGDIHPAPNGTETVPVKKGVGPQVLKILPVSTFSGAKLAEISDDLRQCMVCLEDFIEGERLRWLPCLHTFHCSCIDTWLKSSTSCPICKCDVEKSQGSPRPSGGGMCDEVSSLASPTTTEGANNPLPPHIYSQTPRQSDEQSPSSPRCNLPFSLFPPSIISHRLPLVHAATPPK